MRHVYGCGPDRFQVRINTVKQFVFLPTILFMKYLDWLMFANAEPPKEE